MPRRADSGADRGLFSLPVLPPQTAFPQVAVWRQPVEAGAENSAGSARSSAALSYDLAISLNMSNRESGNHGR